ncbi:MAG TPA: excinuclease ABC subunit UvrC [Candidatus Paceibacterota bacterium]|nr:excinuclease ABC subunit UvrC [Candidatus Paceibacterota bacterium]
MVVTEIIRQKLSTLPHKPGIYLHKDRFGTVIYVGKARDLRKRVSSYFQPSRRMGWDLKFRALVDAIHDFDFHLVRSEPEALLLESRLIKEFHPRYNVSFRDDKNYLMLKVNLNDPIPRFTLTRIKQADGARYFGPFPNSGALRSTLALVRRQYHLRGCRPLTPTERDYRHCLYAHLKYCTAPCIANVTRDQYLEQVTAACDFLAGQCQEMRGQLEEEMKKAAANQEYEKAAQLRDMIADLKRTTRKTEKFERIPYSLPLSIDPEKDLVELAEVLGLAAPPRKIEGFDISNISGTFAVASMVRFKNGRPDRANYRRFKIKSVVGQNDFASMAEVVGRRYSRLLKESKVRSPRSEEEGGEAVPQALQVMVDDVSATAKRRGRVDSKTDSAAMDVRQRRAPGAETSVTAAIVPSNMPDLILIDGGKGQLGMAYEELKKLGLEKIPVIGLAKEFEEIYLPGKSEPLRLSHDTGALKLLQRVRDESHRFANTYNAQLRLKRISESILDEFPNIGERRKMALLKKFGSVQRIRMATEEQIAEVPGFGGKAAGELKAFLLARTCEAPNVEAVDTPESNAGLEVL